MPALAERRYLNVAEVGKIVGRSDDTIRRWIEDGLLPASRIGRGPWLISADELDTLLSQPRDNDSARAVGAATAAVDVPQRSTDHRGGALVPSAAPVPPMPAKEAA